MSDIPNWVMIVIINVLTFAISSALTMKFWQIRFEEKIFGLNKKFDEHINRVDREIEKLRDERKEDALRSKEDMTEMKEDIKEIRSMVIEIYKRR